MTADAAATMPDGDGEIKVAALLHVPVLITGASRLDREMCARLIHANGVEAKGPFVTCFSNGGAEAAHDRAGSLEHGQPDDFASMSGRFMQARSGTLYIDDVVTLTAPAQLLLLSLLDRSSRAVADARSALQPARIIAGAARHLDAQRHAGTVSETLFCRLNQLHIDLTDRQGD